MKQTQTMPNRGFPASEFESRLFRAQTLMKSHGVDALLLTTEPEVRYFSGFLTQFWQSPTRPWFLVVPLRGKPIAVIPAIGANHMANTWLDDIRTWPSPAPEDDGLSLLTLTLQEVAGATGRVGVPMGPETHLRMPLADFDTLRAARHSAEFVDATPLIRTLRLVKSEAEIAKIAYICDLVSAAFEALPDLLPNTSTVQAAFRTFKIEILRRGADDVPYLVGGAGPGGYTHRFDRQHEVPGMADAARVVAQRQVGFGDADRQVVPPHFRVLLYLLSCLRAVFHTVSAVYLFRNGFYLLLYGPVRRIQEFKLGFLFRGAHYSFCEFRAAL